VKKLLKLNMHSEKVCFTIETEHCCGQTITEPDRFQLEIHKDCVSDTCPIITFFDLDVGDDGELCLPINDDFKELCSGRYIFRFILDECIKVKDVKFKWGSVPKVTNVIVTDSEDSEITDGTIMPLTCCPACGCEDSEVSACGTCCSKCDCPPEYYDPNELLARDC